ncbi:MAG: TetR family transcriptional regulator, partial [Pseudomonadota bacterium]
MKRRSFLLTAAAVLSLGATSTTFADEPAPKVIRVAFSGIGLGNKPASASSILSTVHQKGFLEQEFAKDGIKVEWSFFAGAGPATNEALALKKIDFATQGDLPLVVARSNGLRTKILAADSFLSKTYLIVPNGKPYQKLEDLKGKKVGVQKGTAGQLRLARLFENVGLTQDDFKLIDMNTETQNAAISTGEVDAVLSSSTDLIARGLARRILTVDDPKVISPSQIWASEEFEQKHPEIVQRFVNVVVSTAAWAA